MANTKANSIMFILHHASEVWIIMGYLVFQLLYRLWGICWLFGAFAIGFGAIVFIDVAHKDGAISALCGGLLFNLASPVVMLFDVLPKIKHETQIIRKTIVWRYALLSTIVFATAVAFHMNRDVAQQILMPMVVPMPILCVLGYLVHGVLLIQQWREGRLKNCDEKWASYMPQNQDRAFFLFASDMS